MVPNKPHETKKYLLDQTSPDEIQKLKQYGERYLKFHWDYYCELAYQRSSVEVEIRHALLDAVVGPFKFKKWQRVLRWKYSNEPLCVAGSLTDPGGRFNIGDISKDHFKPFPALYVAKDKETALQEALCQSISKENEKRALESALANPTSTTNCSMSGKLYRLLDLNKPKKLQEFIDVIKDFRIPEDLRRRARIFKETLELATTVQNLMEGVLINNWRVWPMQFDVPAPSQILGQLVVGIGVEGILYPSKFTTKDCLAIFPQNLMNPEPTSNWMIRLHQKRC